MDFSFNLPVIIKYGNSALADIAKAHTKQNLFIMASGSVYKTGILDSIPTLFQPNKYMFYTGITPNPDIKELLATFAIAKDFGADLLLAIGGGSVLDAAKCIAVMLANNGEIAACKSDSMHNPPIPLICAPTTSGTGSEVTNVSVITDNQEKRPYVSNALWPKYACIVPKLSYSMPRKVAAETGWDAFCHAFEAYWSKGSNPFSDTLAKSAIKLILQNIEDSANSSIEQARDNMSYASLLAGMAFSQTRTTAPHAVSFLLTSVYGLSHGRACAITLSGFIEYCNGYWDKKQKQLLDFLGFSSFEDFKGDLLLKLEQTGMPIKLSQVGLAKEDILLLAQEGIKHSIAHQMPRTITAPSLQKVLESLL